MVQWKRLAEIIDKVFHLHRRGRDLKNSVTTVDDVAFSPNEYVIILREKDFLSLT